MKITLLGTGTSFPDPGRVQSGILVEAEKKTFLLDIGSGVLHRLIQTGIDLKKLDSVFISHFHIDHCSDFLTLCQSLWLAGYDKRLELYAPDTVREWSRGVRDIAFPYLREKLIVEETVLEENHVVQLGPVQVSTAPTTHSTMETRAFRVESRGRSVVYSSDSAPCREVTDLAKGADVLVHEVNWLDGPHPEGVHTSPSELAEIVERAEPKKVVLTHVSPEVVESQERVITIVGRRTQAEVVLGHDLMVLNI
ncbi:MAG: MBL fold metallo-hydrolase [Candidatus Thorarchaeota archaeon]|jgi:ribonuclease BN (tRNA processing enzyme)